MSEKIIRWWPLICIILSIIGIVGYACITSNIFELISFTFGKMVVCLLPLAVSSVLGLYRWKHSQYDPPKWSIWVCGLILVLFSVYWVAKFITRIDWYVEAYMEGYIMCSGFFPLLTALIALPILQMLQFVLLLLGFLKSKTSKNNQRKQSRSGSLDNCCQQNRPLDIQQEG